MSETTNTISKPVVLQMDGNQWCATRPDFINLQESLAGFGDTQDEAIQSLYEAWCAEKSAAFEAARTAEIKHQNLIYDRRPHKPASYAKDREAAQKAYVAADVRAERAYEAVVELRAELKKRRSGTD